MYSEKNTREIIQLFQDGIGVTLEMFLIMWCIIFITIIFIGNVYLMLTSWRHRRTTKAVIVTVGTNFIILSSWFPFFIVTAVTLITGKRSPGLYHIPHCFNLAGKCLSPLVFIMSVRSLKRTVFWDID